MELAKPVKLRDDVLPTKLEIFEHFLFLTKEKCRSGEWQKNTDLSIKIGTVRDDVKELWDRTGIMHGLGGKYGLRRISNLITSCKNLFKVPKLRRQAGFASELQVLFDVAVCQHQDPETCTCDSQDKIPGVWKAFLTDQRGPRRLNGVLSTRTMSLRGAADKAKKAQEYKDMARYKMEQLVMEQGREAYQEGQVRQDELILLEYDLLEASEELSEEDEVHEDEKEESDSDWEDLEEDEPTPQPIYNTLSLKHFSMACDRFHVPDRAAAMVGNGLLRDIGYVKKGSPAMLLCKNKVRRQREKWGKIIVKEKKKDTQVQGLYTDGKRVPTIVRETTVTKVQVPGRRGRAAYRTISSTSNKTVVQDHYPVVAEPGSEYVTHITPESGTGLALAQELITVIRDREAKVRVIGMDGCSVNTGIHNGAIRLVEVMLGDVVQHVICGLHLNELLLWHIISETDGVTKGPDSLSGPVGSTLHQDIWTQRVVAFHPIPGKVADLPVEVVDDLSRDQLLAYKYAKAIQSGNMPDNLVGQTIGPMVTSRWLTTAIRIMCKYTRTQKPNQRLVRLTKVVLNLYLPGWFKFKSCPHIQSGAENFFFLLQLSRSEVLSEIDQTITQNVLQDNAYWAHPENILISMLGDAREEVRTRAVLRILKARREFDPYTHPRQFVPPVVKFDAQNYFDMIDWDLEMSTEPPLTIDLKLEEILSAKATPLKLPPFPNSTQAVERMVRVVSEAATRRVGHTARDGLILNLLESRKQVPKFDTKRDATF